MNESKRKNRSQIRFNAMNSWNKLMPAHRTVVWPINSTEFVDANRAQLIKLKVESNGNIGRVMGKKGFTAVYK